MKYIKWFVGVALGSLALLVVVFGLANLRDDDLDPAAVKMLAEPVPVSEAGTKAFYYLLGVRAGETGNPEAKGQQLWNEAAALPVTDEAKFFKDRLTHAWTGLSVPVNPANLVSEEWKNRPELRAALAKARPELDQYIHLIEYGEFSPLHTRDLYTAANSAPQMILKGGRLLEVYRGQLVAEGNWKLAEKLAREEAHFQKSFWGGHTLLNTMVATVILRGDAHFLDEETKHHPKFKVSPATVSELTMPDGKVIIHQALETEFRHFAAVMPMIMSQGVYKFFRAESPSLFKYAPVRAVLLPNEAINKYYAFVRDAEEKRCADNSCYASVQWSQPKHAWQWLRNPLGRRVMWIFTISLNKRFESLEASRMKIEDIAKRLH